MAKITSVNNLPATGSVAMYQFKETLKLAGWTVESSSDGTTYNSSGDQISSGSSGANGMANTNAWFRIRDPGGMREFTFQRGTTDLLWRTKYSALDRFIGGSPSATQTPTATDGQIINGGGTDASPTFFTLFTTNGTYRWHVIADNAVSGPALGAAYGFWALASLTTSSSARTAICLEPLLPGTYPVCDDRTNPTTGDADPCVVFFAYTGTEIPWQLTDTNGAWSASTDANLPAKGWYRMNMAGETFTAFPAMRVRENDAGNQQMFSNLVNANPYTGGEEITPMLLCRTNQRVTAVGMKGFTSKIKMKGGPTRSYPDTITLSSDSYVVVGTTGGFVIPWEDGTTPLS